MDSMLSHADIQANGNRTFTEQLRSSTVRAQTLPTSTNRRHGSPRWLIAESIPTRSRSGFVICGAGWQPQNSATTEKDPWCPWLSVALRGLSWMRSTSPS